MDFRSFLIVRKYLHRGDYGSLVRDQFEDAVLNKFKASPRIDLPSEFESYLESHRYGRDAVKRANATSFGELRQKWQLYCLENFLPTTSYPNTYLVGRKLNQDSLEKRLVAQFLNKNPVRNGGTFVQDGDTIAIPEGSSSFYAGMAAIALRTKLGIVTSNGPLIHEYNANSQVAGRVREFFSIGGAVNADQGATFGEIAQTQYEQAIIRSPGTTVIVVPVSGITPENGPFATEGSVRNLKTHLIDIGLKAQVREILFIATWRKHFQSNSAGSSNEPYGSPVYADDRWKDLLRNNITRMSLITSPPPAVRHAIDLGTRYSDPQGRHLAGLSNADQGVLGLKKQDLDYDLAARQLYDQFQGRFFEATEVNTGFI
jgi:hypothetical protein